MFSKQLLLAVFLGFAIQAAPASPPANDNLADAILVTANGATSSVVNTEATNEASDPPEAGYRSVWWIYRPRVNGRLTVSTTTSDSFDKEFAAYVGPGLQVISYQRGSSGGVLTASFPVTLGTDYWISVGSHNSWTGQGATGTISLGFALNTQSDISSLPIQHSASMGNDSFSQRPILTNYTAGAIGYNFSSTTEAAASEPASAGYQTLWWTYHAPANGRLALSTTGSDDFSKILSVYQGATLPNLKLIATGTNNTVTYSLPVTQNTDYQICIGSKNTPGFGIANGSVVLSLNLDPQADVANLNLAVAATADNDTFSKRVILPGVNVSAIGYNTSANREPLEPTGTHERTVWWSWTAPAAGATVVDLSYSDAISKWVTVWRGNTLSGLVQVPASSQATDPPRVTFTATAGETYHIAVANNSGSEPGGSIVLTIGGPSGPATNAVPAVVINQAVHLRWFANTGFKYQVQQSATGQSWTNMGMPIQGDGTYKDFYDTMSQERGFYRIFLQ